MTTIVKRKKAMSVSPLKASQPVGASLAYLGFRGAIPLMHGSQGCTAFAKVYFVRHFREPVPLQTTAMDQVSAVMGADGSIVQALVNICKGSAPAMIGLCSTGLAETQGCDLRGAVRTFREQHPEYASTAVAWANTPDFSGCFESGYALGVESVIEQLVPERTAGDRGASSNVVNVLAGSMLTPGDVEAIEDLVERFGLRARVLPDISASLGGELLDQDFSPVTIGGTPLEALSDLHTARATLVIGASLARAGALLERKTGLRTFSFAHLHTLRAVDAFVDTLAHLSPASGVPERVERWRRQLQDALLDTHFMLGFRRVAIAADGDLLAAFADLVRSCGGEVVAAVTPAKAPALSSVAADEVTIGDLGDLEQLAKERGAELMIANSHAVSTAERLGLPLLQAGFPQYELIGGYQRTWVGYRGVRDTLFDLANRFHQLGTGEIAPYHSVLSQKLFEHGESRQRTAE